jgi:deazaflavin-dependent oxidoreductase (nitroreductase family)
LTSSRLEVLGWSHDEHRGLLPHTTGRRTGRPHRIEIWYLAAEGTVYLFSGGGDQADWVRNLRHDPHVLLELAGRPAAAYDAVVVQEPDEALRREMDAKYHDTLPDRELTSWAQHSLVVRLTPAG